MLKIKVNGYHVKAHAEGYADDVMAEMMLAVKDFYTHLDPKLKETFKTTFLSKDALDEIFSDKEDKEEDDIDLKSTAEPNSVNECFERAGELIGALESVLEELQNEYKHKRD